MPLDIFLPYKNNFELFIKDFCPDWYENFHDWQFDIVRYFDRCFKEEKQTIKICIVGAKGVGKTLVICLFTVFIMLTEDRAAINATAGTKEQIKNVIFRGIKNALQKTDLLNHIIVGDLRCKYKDPALGELYSSEITHLPLPKITKDNTQTSVVSGRHGDVEVLMIDEANQVPQQLIQQLMTSSSQQRNIFIMLANPEVKTDTSPLSYCGKVMTGFFDRSEPNLERYNWQRFRISLDDCNKMSEERKEEIKHGFEYSGTADLEYRRCVLGEYGDSTANSLLFTLEDLLKCIRRDSLIDLTYDKNCIFGIDVSYGKTRDYSVITCFKGSKFYMVLCSNIISPDQLKEKIIDLSGICKGGLFYIDNYGVGACIYDALKNTGIHIYPVNGNQQVNGSIYFDTRTLLYGRLAALIKKGLITVNLEEDDYVSYKNLKEESSYITVDYSDNGKLFVDNKKRTSHTSCDCLDAMSYALAGHNREEFDLFYRNLLSAKRLQI